MLSTKWTALLLITFALVLGGCADGGQAAAMPSAAAPATATVAASTATPAATATPVFTATVTATPTITLTPTTPPTPTPDTRMLPESWGGWPPVPEVSMHVADIFRRGQELGNNPHAFSVVGDCQSEPNVFLGIYATDRYWLTDKYAYLQETIDWFAGSFDHHSVSVKDGQSVASALNPMWADPAQCKPGENPVACELRVYKPAFMFINLGTNWKNGGPTAHEKYLREIVQLALDNGTIPILTTKADNIEGDNSLNAATARVAYDMDVPLMNFWLAATSLENNGLDPEREDMYLTPTAWDLRNFTALMTLDTVWKKIREAATLEQQRLAGPGG